MRELPAHLGGHLNKVHIDEGIYHEIVNVWGWQSMIDIGCGPGDWVRKLQQAGLECYGVDGDFTLNLCESTFVTHDFSHGPIGQSILGDRSVDLVWSCEFLEHVEERYLPNFMPCFQRSSRYILCTAAPPGTPGHHHVNCQPPEYWITVFHDYGFEYDPSLTRYFKSKSTMPKPFFKNHGLVFRRV